MIPIETHKKLMGLWPGRKYAEPGRLKKRLHHLELLLPLLSGKDVFELASNAGITAAEITKHSRSYVGVEPDEDYYSQSLITKGACYPGRTAQFKNGYLFDHSKEEYNAFVICVALYLLNGKEKDELEKEVFPKCDIVIIQERTARRPVTKKYNRFSFHKPKAIRNFLVENGFNADIYYSTKEKYFEIIGIKV